MNAAKWLLILAASVSLLTGAALNSAAQKPKAQAESTLKLFAGAKPDDYIGDQACAVCHADEVADFHKSSHAQYVADPKLPLGKQGCESCHGPGKQHQDEEGGHMVYFEKITPKDVNAVCLRCHEDVMKQSQWHSEAHARAGLSCISCHQIHPSSNPESFVDPHGHGIIKGPVFPSAKESGPLLKSDEATLCGSCHHIQVAEFRLNSHHPVPEGRLVCSDCHAIHPTTASTRIDTPVKDNCVSCHADKAGPFVYEHDPVAGWMGRGCLECHNPHGSHNPRLLNAFSRGLCAQCHTDKLTNHFPGLSCWNAGCHVALHGSNTDPHFLAH